MITRIYIDTSIVGGFFDKEFDEATQALFKQLENKEVIFVVSNVLDDELKKAPQHIQKLLNNYDKDCFEKVFLTDEAKYLADCYVAEKVIGKTSLDDCRHIAIATINNVNVLASWNFKHIVNLNRIRGYNAVNMKKGYNILEIRTPKELINYGT